MNKGTQNQEKTIVKEVPKSVKVSQFGCMNCLWHCIECKNGSKYETKDNEVDCTTYTYFD